MRTVDSVMQEAIEAHKAFDWPRAEFLYCTVIAHAEDYPDGYALLGALYAQAQAPGRALTFLRRALDLAPQHAPAMQNIAGVYRLLGKLEKSIEWNKKSLEIERNPHILSNLSGCYINQGDPQQALEYADEALTIKPDFPEAGNHRALALLEMGRFAEGWAQYDSRMDCVIRTEDNTVMQAKFTRRPYTVPMWTGKPVKLLAIHGEQGLGDEIMFLTCLKQLREIYDIGDVVIEAAPRLVKLLHNSLGLRVYGTHGELVANEKPDAYLPMGSLPRFVWPVVPNAYLRPTREYPRAEQYRIGLSWFGGTMQTHMDLRNTMVEHWRVLPDDNAEFISLQYGPRAEEAMRLGVPHDEEGIADLDMLSAMIKSCDLVVTVCNTTFHMAGALNVPCLVLVPSKPDWRCGLTGEKMVWYDSVTMLRQQPGESWPHVLNRAKDWIATHRRVSGTESPVA